MSCQTYAPILEEVYVNWGEGNGEVEMIGLSPYDDNQVINDYKLEFGLTNPCAGQEGNAGEAIAKLIEGQPFYGYPTYCVICPDGKMLFDVCSPPDTQCFDSFIVSCGATATDEMEESSPILNIYPNPAKDHAYISGAKPGTVYEVLNSQGQLMQSGVLDGQSFINIQAMYSGLYFVKLKLDGQIKILKLIKE